MKHRCEAQLQKEGTCEKKEGKCPITVSVLDEPLSQFHKVSGPLSLGMEGKGLCFGGAVWTARQSNSGFSISF